MTDVAYYRSVKAAGAQQFCADPAHRVEDGLDPHAERGTADQVTSPADRPDAGYGGAQTVRPSHQHYWYVHWRVHMFSLHVAV